VDAAITDGVDDIRVTPATLYRAVLLAFVLLVVVLVFPEIASLLLLVLLIAVVAVPLSSATDRVEKLGVPRGMGAPLLLLGAVGVIGGIIALLVPVFVSEGNQLVNSLPSIVHSLRREVGHLTHRPPAQVGADLHAYVHGYTSRPQRLLGPATAVGAGVAGGLTTLVVVTLTALYTAIRPEPLMHSAVRLVSPPKRGHAEYILRRLAHAYIGWLKGLAIGMLILWVITYAGLRLIGLPYAVVFATLTALAMVVPYYGALVSSVPPILLALTISPGKALLVAAIYVFSHLIEGNVVEPLVMARAVALHPAVVALGVIAVERLFGFIGLALAVPILVTFKILVEQLWVRPQEAAHSGRAPPDAREPVVPDVEAEDEEASERRFTREDAEVAARRGVQPPPRL
jgi:predicted PurR-regulated permease PerM